MVGTLQSLTQTLQSTDLLQVRHAQLVAERKKRATIYRGHPLTQLPFADVNQSL